MKAWTPKITLTAMFIALGLVLPMIFHAIGLGSTFLPMFWPVAAGAFFLPVSFALLLGLLTPLISGFLTGMPPFSPPIVYIMMAELAVLAVVIAALHERTRLGVFLVLFIALTASRLILYTAVHWMAPWIGLPPKIFSLAALVRSLPGVILLLFLVPTLVGRIKKNTLHGRGR